MLKCQNLQHSPVPQNHSTRFIRRHAVTPWPFQLTLEPG
ncbi:hypothetical protein ALO42_102086 [Pseudomonas syringae pv. atrofaciens]|nr:hypothetical protein ALO42_102086 [Pseudomonas syringae pv. atrofaciens]